jgi:hypothetical protein
LVQRLKQEGRQLRTAGAETINRATAGQVGELSGGKLRRGKGGAITKVEWNNPAYMKEGIEEAKKVQAKGAQIVARGKGMEEGAKKLGGTRKTMEDSGGTGSQAYKIEFLLALIRFRILFW